MYCSKPRLSGCALALSGGGFRATLFHVGSLWRLNELGYLRGLSEITSVSGGSITAAWLGLRWKDLAFDRCGVARNFRQVVAEPLKSFCGKTIDVNIILGSILSPFKHPSELLVARYDKHLFKGSTLQALPGKGEGPRFTIYATSLQTGASVRFSRQYLAEYHLGRVMEPDVPLAAAVAASSAFPPPLCPVKLELDAEKWERLRGADLFDLRTLRETMFLGDGGIYDNLGLERIWDRYDTVLISDAGAPFKVTSRAHMRMIRISQLARTKRTLDIMGAQVRALRVRRVIAELDSKKVKGAYWGIATHIDGYKLAKYGKHPPMVHDNSTTGELSKVRTRLNRFHPEEQGRLINWGYALADAALRRYLTDDVVEPGRWPEPDFAL